MRLADTAMHMLKVSTAAHHPIAEMLTTFATVRALVLEDMDASLDPVKWSRILRINGGPDYVPPSDPAGIRKAILDAFDACATTASTDRTKARRLCYAIVTGTRGHRTSVALKQTLALIRSAEHI